MNKLLYFVAGAAIGSLATWVITKRYYENVANDAIDSVKDLYTVEKASEPEEKKTAEETEESEPEEKKIIIPGHFTPEQQARYEKMARVYEETKTKERERMMSFKPYVISPDEFDEIDEYDTITYYYTADGYVVDEDYEIVEDIPGTITYDALNHFGEYEDDSVFVRNDVLKCDFEILKSAKTLEEFQV